MSLFYILDEQKNPVPADMEGMCSWRKDKDEPVRVGKTNVGPFFVSTVFLGIDHRFGTDGPPILFETMIFRGESMSEEYQTRYATWNEAEAGHKVAVAEAIRNLNWLQWIIFQISRLFNSETESEGK